MNFKTLDELDELKERLSDLLQLIEELSQSCQSEPISEMAEALTQIENRVIQGKEILKQIKRL